MKKSNLFYLFINCSLIMIVFIFYILFQLDYIKVSFKIISFFGMFINISILLLFYKKYKSIKSVYFLFQLLSIPFLHGLIFCKYVLNYISHDFDYSFLVTQHSLIVAIFFTMLCQLFLNFGYEIIYNKKQNDDDINNDKNEFLQNYLTVGIILIIISIIPTVDNYFNTLQICLQYGYRGEILSRSIGISSIFDKLTPFFYIGLLFLLYGSKEKNFFSKIILLFGLVFYGSQILFGARGKPLLEVLCLVWFYHYFIHSFSSKKILLSILFLFLFVPFLNVIQDVRNNGINYWISNTGKLIKSNYIETNPILDLNYEVGQTIYPLAYAIDYFPKVNNYKYGKNYLLSIYSIVRINTSSTRNNDFNKELNIANELGSSAGAAWGGSYLQELYGNFGLFSVIVVFLLGIIFMVLDRKLSRCNNGITAIFITYSLTYILWTIRNNFCEVPRAIVWYLLPTYILVLLIWGRRKKSVS